ncbi:MAG: hypothetical protein PHC34_10830 [Candidatus Gastranaerophilales bacterium]|nr:hypothetical protein [Candidatus Gastranaerophilales bacterium]
MREIKLNINKKHLSAFISLIWLATCQLSYSYDNIAPSNIPEQTAQVSVPLQGRAIVIDVTSDKLNYLYDKNQFVATGSAEVVIKQQNSKLEADKITYDQNKQIVIAENNVKITKNGNVVFGSYAKIYLDRESALINDPVTIISGVKIRSKTATTIPDKLEAFNGTAIIDSASMNGIPYKITSSEFKNWLTNFDVPDKNKSILENTKIASKEIDIDSLSDRNIITLKNSTIYAGKYKIAKISKMVLTTGKDIKNIETMLPEIGQNPAMGLYYGPSHVFFTPQGATLKVSPIMSFSTKSDASLLGGGVMTRYMSESNKTEVGFTTNRNKAMVKGEQNLSPYTKIIYGTNSYNDNGFYGNCLSEYIAEVVDNRKLASMMNFDFNLRSSAGYSQDYYKNMGTMKFQLQGELLNPEPIYSYKNDLFQVRTLSQANISVYGTGNTSGIIRTGPWVNSKIGKLSLHGAYLQSAIYGDTPFLYDQFLPGKSNVIEGIDYKINKYFNVGHYGSYNLKKDNWNKKMFAENIIYIRIGPEDVKFTIAYDLARNFSRIGTELLIGKETKTAIDFDKLKVKQRKK